MSYNATNQQVLGKLATASLALALCAAGAIAAAGDEEGPPANLKSAPMQAAAPKAVSIWSAQTSEEYPPLTASNGQLVSAMQCRGSNCDNVLLGYENVGANHTSNSWTSYFSEEGTNFRLCGGNSFMTGLSCRDRYCDDVSLQCTVVTGKTKGSCKWMPWFSEEAQYSYLDAGYYASGLACRGNYCDDFAIYACQAR